MVGCASRPTTVRLGQARAEGGGERACGGHAAKRIDAIALDARPKSATFDRRMNGARTATRTVTCAARGAGNPTPMEPAGDDDREAAAPLLRAACDAPAQCYDGFTLSGDAEEDLGELSGRCAAACGMTPLTRVHEGRASDADLPSVYAVELEASTCYRFFAVAERGVSVLVAALTDEGGAIAAMDNSRDRAPILGPREAFCPSRGGRYFLVVTAARGAGRYVVQGWSKPRAP